MEENKQENQPIEDVQEKDGILRPNISYETLLKSQSTPNQQMTARVEQYNHNQGFKPMEAAQPSTKEKPMIQVPDGKVSIKPPKKKSSTLVIILLILVLIGLSVGSYFYFTQVYLKLNAPATTPTEENPEGENAIIEEVRDKVTSCSLESSYPAFGYTLTTTYRYYTSDDKLKQYVEKTVMEYLEESTNEQSVCESVSSRYLGYDGYSHLCNQIDAKNYEYTKIIDLTVLAEKELTFGGQFPTTIKIEQTLDEPIYSYVEKHKELGFTCEEEPGTFLVEESAASEESTS